MLDKKQQFHLEPPTGLMNDPNGLAWYEGLYYVFFQWNPLAKDHTHKEWGWYTSPDLVRWRFHGSALAPSEPYDQSGVHSGSAIIVKGRLFLYYTGSDKSTGRRRSSQCMAIYDGHEEFAKQGIVVETPPGFTQHFRDPSVFRAPNGTYRMLLGAQRENGLGAVVTFVSHDAVRWQYDGILAVTGEHEMVECPDLVVEGNRAVLLYGLQRRDNARDVTLSACSYYMPMDMTLDDAGAREYVLTSRRLVDEGFDFYAPQTFLAPDGRRLLMAWMSRMEGKDEAVFSGDDPYVHCLTLPREIHIERGHLCQRPANELCGMLGADIQMEPHDGGLRAVIPGHAFRLHLEWETLPERFCLAYEGMRIRWEGGVLELGRRRWTDGREELRTIQVVPRQMEIWTDTSSMEIFINDGDHVMSARFMPTGRPPVLNLSPLRGGYKISLRAVCPSRWQFEKEDTQ